MTLAKTYIPVPPGTSPCFRQARCATPTSFCPPAQSILRRSRRILLLAEDLPVVRSLISVSSMRRSSTSFPMKLTPYSTMRLRGLSRSAAVCVSRGEPQPTRAVHAASADAAQQGTCTSDRGTRRSRFPCLCWSASRTWRCPGASVCERAFLTRASRSGGRGRGPTCRWGVRSCQC